MQSDAGEDQGNPFADLVWDWVRDLPPGSLLVTPGGPWPASRWGHRIVILRRDREYGYRGIIRGTAIDANDVRTWADNEGLAITMGPSPH